MKYILVIFFALFSFDALSGEEKTPRDLSKKVLWQFKTNGQIWSNPASDGERIVFGSDDGHIYALQARTGKPIWQFKTKNRVRSEPLLSRTHVYATSDDGFLYSLSLDTGSLVYKTRIHPSSIHRSMPLEAQNYFYDWSGSSPAMDENFLYVGSADNHFYAIDKTSGKVLWRFKTSGIIRSKPLVMDDRVVFGSRDHNLYAVNKRNGKLLWKFNTEGIVTSEPVLIDQNIVIGSRSAKIFSVKADSGKMNWQHVYEDESWIESSAFPYRDGFFIGSSDSFKLSYFDAKTGNELWNFYTGGWSWAKPLIVDDIVYIGATSAKPYWQKHITSGFFGVDVKTKKLVAQYKPVFQNDVFVNSGVITQPVEMNGILVVADLDGLIRAYSIGKP